MLLRLACLGVTNALAMPRLLPISDPAKDTEILAPRHQITVLERELQGTKVRFAPAPLTDPGQLARLDIRDVTALSASSTSTTTPPELRG